MIILGKDIEYVEFLDSDVNIGMNSGPLIINTKEDDKPFLTFPTPLWVSTLNRDESAAFIVTRDMFRKHLIDIDTDETLKLTHYIW